MMTSDEVMVLREAMKLAGGVAAKPGKSMPVLSNVSLRKQGRMLSVMATDLIATACLMMRMGGGEDFEVLVDAGTFSRVLATVGGDMDMVVEDSRLVVRDEEKRAVSRLEGLPADSMPEIVLARDGGECQEVADMGAGAPVKALVSAMDQVRHAAGGHVPELSGICLRHMGQGALMVIASDGSRLSMREVGTDSGGMDDMPDVLVHAGHARYLSFFVGWLGDFIDLVNARVVRSPASVPHERGGLVLVLSGDEGSLVQVNGMEGEYPHISEEDFLSSHGDDAWAALVPGDALLEFTALAAHISDSEWHDMRVTMEPGGVMVMEARGDSGEVAREVDVSPAMESHISAAGVPGGGDPRCLPGHASHLGHPGNVKLTVNARYIHDAVTALGGQELLMLGGGPEAPLLIYPCEIGGGIARACELIMPMKPGG